MRYHYHCTDGRDLILDRRGRTLRPAVDLERQAELIARRVMSEPGLNSSWLGWIVAVYSDIGEQVAVVPFPEAAPYSTGAFDRANLERCVV